MEQAPILLKKEWNLVKLLPAKKSWYQLQEFWLVKFNQVFDRLYFALFSTSTKWGDPFKTHRPVKMQKKLSFVLAWGLTGPMLHLTSSMGKGVN